MNSGALNALSHRLTQIDAAESARPPEANGSEQVAAARTYTESFVLSDLRTKRWLANQLSP